MKRSIADSFEIIRDYLERVGIETPRAKKLARRFFLFNSKRAWGTQYAFRADLFRRYMRRCHNVDFSEDEIFQVSKRFVVRANGAP